VFVYRVVGFNGRGDGAASGVVAWPDADAVRPAWNPMEGATVYEVSIKDHPGRPCTFLQSTDQTTPVLPVDKALVRFYQVVARR